MMPRSRIRSIFHQTTQRLTVSHFFYIIIQSDYILIKVCLMMRCEKKNPLKNRFLYKLKFSHIKEFYRVIDLLRKQVYAELASSAFDRTK